MRRLVNFAIGASLLPESETTMRIRKENELESSAIASIDSFDLGFLPKTLAMQCRSLIESYHGVHGFASLPDVLWKSRLGPFIEAHSELRRYLKTASTTRSAKKSHDSFVQIATAILSIEILASRFAGWHVLHPDAAERSREILNRNGGESHMPLMEFYLYPPRHISSAAVATLAPRAHLRSWDADLSHSFKPAPSEGNSR